VSSLVLKGKDCFDSAASLCARQSPASSNSDNLNTRQMTGRLRRRGPRSTLALLRRSLPRRCRALPGTTPGESGVDVPVILSSMFSQQSDSKIISSENPAKDPIFTQRKPAAGRGNQTHILLYCINIRCLLSHLGELNYHLNRLQPHIVMLQGT